MRKLLIVILALFCIINLNAQDKPVQIVFDVTSDDPKTHQTAIRHVKAMAAAYPDSEFEVVMYSGSLEMALKEHSTVSDEILSFKDNDKVTFKVCNGTMKRHEVTKDQLLDGVEVVPDGILEIVTKQSEGWGYIKEARK